MPRVITGKYKGAVLMAPKGDNTRPTTDKVKESLFSMIQMDVPDANVLDLFAGTGQIGIESVSRGAKSAVMVDKAGSAIAMIKRNLEKIHAENDDAFRVIKAPISSALETLGAEGAKFDIIFLDPPYKIAFDMAKEVANKIKELNLLSDGGIMIVEHSSDLPFNPEEVGMEFKRSCTYGLTVITFFK